MLCFLVGSGYGSYSCWVGIINQEQVAVKDADACLEARPLGTESIPQDIIAPQSDLYPRRLWGKPEEVLWMTFWDQ